ncbi:hypothetical protein [Geothermobacter ehrlichii]|uniref:hypothetical protein n=1 Tax=Geothermobacter ehrlichii TaxID=213224 RepID=UPI0011E89D90|nr:hypothetical protein [Geothermobacter ehrlichii]
MIETLKRLQKSETQSMFSEQKRAIFRKVKEPGHLRGGVVGYAAQANAQGDAEIAKKGRF